MSVLARPQGSPERVWSLVAGLAALGGRTDRTTFESLINPGYNKAGVMTKTKAELARDTLGAASSLGLVEYNNVEAFLRVDVGSVDQLADHLHHHLTHLSDEDTNSVLLEAYSWVAVESDRHGNLSWIYELDRKTFADQANSALVGEDEDGRPMNETKLAPWRRWLTFIGLEMPLPLPGNPSFPSPVRRLLKEIRLAGLPIGEEVAGQEFLSIIANCAPYLDGGRLFLQACDRMSHSLKPSTLSPVLSAALWDLHDDGAITLRPRGDSTNAVKLTGDASHKIQNFSLVVLNAEEKAA
ncbi:MULTISPECIES: hypothetical protein [Bradyrhizobium]|uniref:hypothetical protein n=1 Tax=Bradyrhizobium TaxID=374 RepID=UPI0011642CC9|nr:MULTISPECIES: hypothetical protein [Bradyrhizobium]QDP22723.1 hypothetical protein FNV92_11390 [Bradyrhizobium cosmicum]